MDFSITNGFASLVLAVSLAGSVPIARGADESAPVDFNREIRPLLSDRCYACHGPDATKREAGLRLDTREGAMAALKSGRRAIVPGRPDQSELMARIHATDDDDRMPPSRLNRPLSDAEKSVLARWIRGGANYAQHWAFAAPERQTPPAVRAPGWARDALDLFVQARFEGRGLAPNPEVERAVWLRRVSLALTGLPPTLEQVEAFENDGSPLAWERQVDALLASPRFGERMAQEWLDVARFADTLGYQVDVPCFVWPWRDWVIRAFNENLPYDAFLTWQIAGDLLPDATQDQRLATLFNRLHRQTNEGGSIEQEFRQEYISDRVHTAGSALLGLTLECSKCHDHKYDPIPQTDYYSLCAMFGRIDESGLYPYGVSTSAAEPSMRLVEPAQQREIEKRTADWDAARAEAEALVPRRAPAFEFWLAQTRSLPQPTPNDHFPLDEIVDGKLPNRVGGRTAGVMSGGVLTPVAGVVNGAMKFDGDTVLQLDGIQGITRHDPLSVSIRVYSPDRKQRALLMHTGPALYALASDASGFELLLEEGKLRWSCIFLWPGCAASIETREDFPVGRWVHITATYDGSSKASGLKLYLDGTPAGVVTLHDHLDKSIVTEKMRLGARPRDDRGFADGSMDEIQVFRRQLSPLEVFHMHSPQLPWDAELNRARAGDREARAQVWEHFLMCVDDGMASARAAVSSALRRLEDEYVHRLPLIMTMKESPNPRPFYVLKRGDYASPDLTRPVEPGAPSALFPFGSELPKNRLGLARWMTDPKNPLVARVAVNRLWMQCFGTGIVLTQENFGMQGDAPSHPELLDALAYEFVNSGWDVKRLLRRIVLSATYRQSSASTPEKREIDPANRLLARGPSFRLSAEAIRDQAQAASGFLAERVGGPSVKPWQPPGVWSEAGASGGEYSPDTGEGAHRRSLYTYRKRTAPPPSLLTLDAGSREICQPRRLITNTPLQPLIFLNDRSFFESAREMARRVSRESGGDPELQLARAWRLLVARSVSPQELAVLTQLFEQQRALFGADPAAAAAVCGRSDPSFAALTLVCSTLLTSDAVITTR